MPKHMQRFLLSIAAIVVAVTASINCTSDRTAFEDEQLDGGTAAPPADFAPPDAGVGDSGEFPPQECKGETQFVYVFTQTATIYRFDPTSLTFAELGRPNCPTSVGPYSMAIDRYGVAWLGYRNGSVHKSPLGSLECTEILLQRPAGANLIKFGMGFSKDESESGESLFLGNNGLWKANPRTLEVERIGQAQPMGSTFELTGTGDGQLYGFDNKNGVVVRLDPVTGDALEIHRTSAIGGAWAFAQWGGAFWLFTSGDSTLNNSSVTRYDPVTRTSTVVVEDAGFVIMGAGVSTCAPFEPPQ